MHRLPAERRFLEGSGGIPPPEAARHAKALHLRDGERVEFFDGAGAVRTFAWNAASGGFAPDGPLREVPRPAGSLTLLACVTKGERWDWTLEKATELGVSRIVPVLSERCVVRIAAADRGAKRARWQKIAEEAARQSGAAWTPEVAAPQTFGEAVALARATVCFAGILSDPPPPPILEAFRRSGAGSDCDISLFTGPEGDFSPEEKERLCGFAYPVSFGTAVLRAETAAIFGLSAIKAALL